MNLPIRVNVEDHGRALQVWNAMTLGHYFAFIDETKVPKSGREQRLVAEPAKSHRVLPLVGDPIELPGFTMVPKNRRCDPVGTIVADRDLYRAEQDIVYLFIAVPGATGDGFKLCLEASGPAFDLPAAEARARHRCRDVLDAPSGKLHRFASCR